MSLTRSVAPLLVIRRVSWSRSCSINSPAIDLHDLARSMTSGERIHSRGIFALSASILAWTICLHGAGLGEKKPMKLRSRRKSTMRTMDRTGSLQKPQSYSMKPLPIYKRRRRALMAPRLKSHAASVWQEPRTTNHHTRGRYRRAPGVPPGPTTGRPSLASLPRRGGTPPSNRTTASSTDR